MLRLPTGVPSVPHDLDTGLSTPGKAGSNFSKDGLVPETPLEASCFALSEQDALKGFLGESLPVENYSCLPNVCEVLDLLSSGLVGSLSAGSAGMIEAQIAFSNWESTHQTPRVRDDIFDYDQMCDSSRGLCLPPAVTPKTSDLSGYETRHIPPWTNLSKDPSWPNHSLGQISQRQEPENLIFPTPGIVAALPIIPQTLHKNGEICTLQDYDQFSGQPLGLHTNNSLVRSKSCSALNHQDETGIGIHSDQSPGDLNSWVGSLDSFLDSLASEDNSQFHFIGSSLLSSSGSSPEAGLTITTVENHPISPPKQRRQTHQAGSENCQYCGATFLRPSELKRHTSKHILPYKCPNHGCTCAFAQRKDLDRHLSTRKHWQNENKPLPRVFCYVKGCRFATEGFTRKDNLLRHVRRIHGRLAQGNGVGGKADSL